MKAYLHGRIDCGSCKWPLYSDEDVVYCVNIECPEMNKRYKAPTIELESERAELSIGHTPGFKADDPNHQFAKPESEPE